MGKMLNALIFIVALNFALIFFSNSQNMAVQVENLQNSSSYGNSTNSALQGFIMNPTLWVDNNLIFVLFGTLATIGGLIIGTFWIKNDFVVFATIVLGLFSFGVPLVDLWRVVASQGQVFCTAAVYTQGCGVVEARLCASLLFFGILLWYAWTIIDFWRAKD